MEDYVKDFTRAQRRCEREKVKARIRKRIWRQYFRYNYDCAKITRDNPEIAWLVKCYCPKDGKSHCRVYRCCSTDCDWCQRNLTRQRTKLDTLARYELSVAEDEWNDQTNEALGGIIQDI